MEPIGLLFVGAAVLAGSVALLSCAKKSSAKAAPAADQSGAATPGAPAGAKEGEPAHVVPDRVSLDAVCRDEGGTQSAWRRSRHGQVGDRGRTGRVRQVQGVGCDVRHHRRRRPARRGRRTEGGPGRHLPADAARRGPRASSVPEGGAQSQGLSDLQLSRTSPNCSSAGLNLLPPDEHSLVMCCPTNRYLFVMCPSLDSCISKS